MNKGKIIVFEGLDYSFKEYNSKKLYEYIKENITKKVILLSFPNYESNSSYFVNEYLQGNYGECSEVDEKECTLLYAVDRYDTIKKNNVKELLEEGYYIIMDRYIGSNLIFQTAKIFNREKDIIDDNDIGITTGLIDSKINDYIEWALDLELNILNLPKWDKVIYMNMPLNISYPLMKERDLKNGKEEDGHESNKQFLQCVEMNAIRLCDKLNWNIVNCVDSGNNIRSEEDIFDNIKHILSL